LRGRQQRIFMRYSVPEVSCYTVENGDAAAGRARWSRRTAFPLQSEPFDGEQSTGAAGGSSGQRRSGKVWRRSCSRRGTAGGGARPPPLLESPALCYWSGRGRPAGAQDQPAGGASPGPASGGREPRSGRRGREPRSAPSLDLKFGSPLEKKRFRKGFFAKGTVNGLDRWGGHLNWAGGSSFIYDTFDPTMSNKV
jgi:hypothetical protein